VVLVLYWQHMIGHTRIFLDSGNPTETKRALGMLGQLDGQTTNPSLVAKNPEIKVQEGEMSESELLDAYKKIIQDIHQQIPDGDISIEVYADKSSSAQSMVDQARAFSQWIPNPFIKLPITRSGLEAAEILSGEGVNINMTLCFSPEQALAVHGATKGAEKGQVVVSPFVGRLDDFGICGISLVETIGSLYKGLDSHVHVLAASLRNIDHFYACITMGVDIITSPLKHISSWYEKGAELPEGYEYTHAPDSELVNVEYASDDTQQAWQYFDIQHDLTDKGLQKFADDWNTLIKRP